MPYYIAPYIGAGSDLDPFRPRGSDQPGWSAIDLRADGGATLGGGGLNACLLHLPTADPDPQLRLVALDPADTIGVGVRQAIIARLGLLASPASVRWDDLAMEILLGPPPGGWKALRSNLAGAFEIWLGGLLKRLPVVRGGTSLAEDWNCADSTSLTCDLTWTEYLGTAWGITSNVARFDGIVGSNGARADSDLASDDHFAQATVVFLNLFNTTAGYVICRKDGTTTNTAYEFSVQQAGSLTHILRKVITGTSTTLATGSGTHADGDVIRIEADGSTITGKKNGTTDAGPATDTAITGNVRCGIRGFGDTLASQVQFDNWSAGDLAVAAGAPPGHGALLSGFRNSVIQRV